MATVFIGLIQTPRIPVDPGSDLVDLFPLLTDGMALEKSELPDNSSDQKGIANTCYQHIYR